MDGQKVNGCVAQEWYTQVYTLCLKHEIPICRRTGFSCCWVGDEAKCNHYKERKGGAE